MKMVDEAGAIVAMRHARRPCVTIAIDSMTFKQPVHVGQLMVCQARVTYVGKHAIEVQVLVHAENVLTREVTHTNSAYCVYVSLGPDGKSAVAPPLVLETDEDRQLFSEGEARQRRRTAR
jgi:acyl-CoA hydrolase